MKTEIGVRFACRDKLVYLIEAGEVVQRLRRGFADSRPPARPGRDDFTAGNQLVAFRLHVRILP